MRCSKHLIVFGLCVFAATGFGLVHSTNQDYGGRSCKTTLNKMCKDGWSVSDPATKRCSCNLKFGGEFEEINFSGNNNSNNKVITEEMGIAGNPAAFTVNDPEVNTFHESSVPLCIPCRFFLGRMITSFKNKQGEDAGTCEFRSYSFTQKTRKGFLVAGYDVAIELKYLNGTHKMMSFRQPGQAFKGLAYYHEDVINFYDSNTDLKIKGDFDKSTSLVTLNAEKCGVKILFRPYDLRIRRDEPPIPPLSISVNRANQAVFKTLDKIVTMPPKDDISGISLSGLFRGTIISGTPHNSHKNNRQCAMANSNLAFCKKARITYAMSRCLFILNLPRFVSCYDRRLSGFRIVDLFNDCISVQCHVMSCKSMLKKIAKSRCDKLQDPIPEVEALIAWCSLR